MPPVFPAALPAEEAERDRDQRIHARGEVEREARDEDEAEENRQGLAREAVLRLRRAAALQALDERLGRLEARDARPPSPFRPARGRGSSGRPATFHFSRRAAAPSGAVARRGRRPRPGCRRPRATPPEGPPRRTAAPKTSSFAGFASAPAFATSIVSVAVSSAGGQALVVVAGLVREHGRERARAPGRPSRRRCRARRRRSVPRRRRASGRRTRTSSRLSFGYATAENASPAAA